MQKKTYQKLGLLKCLFLVVYVNFFAVQLHFRYASSFATDIQTEASFSESTSSKAQGIEKNNPSKKAIPQVKLNKRFYPTPILETVALQFRIQPKVLFVKKVTGSPTPPLCRTTLLCSLLRGPPSVA